MTTPHRLVNPDSLAPPSGFSHAVVAAPGRTVHVAGQTAQAADGTIQGTTICEQFGVAAANLVTALEAAGGRPEHVVSLQILVTDVDEYRASLAELGEIYRRLLGRHYPAVVLFGVTRLFDAAAKVELVAQAVVPES
jgi:enamine deaminase RidA (YjgF/YER057c/UK114 family)